MDKTEKDLEKLLESECSKAEQERDEHADCD